VTLGVRVDAGVGSEVEAVERRDVVRLQFEVEDRQAMRVGSAVFGMTTSPFWMCQRSTTWAGVRPYLAATSPTTGSPSTPMIGDHDSVTMPCASSNARCSRRWMAGEIWIWLMAGTTSVSASNVSRWAGVKLETPIERTSPSACNFSKVRQVETNSPRAGSGQWISSRST
jgi:hypothetical protein